MKLGENTNIRNTEAAVWGPKYGPRPWIRPEKHSFKGRIQWAVGLFTAEDCAEVFLIFTTRYNT